MNILRQRRDVKRHENIAFGYIEYVILTKPEIKSFITHYLLRQCKLRFVFTKAVAVTNKGVGGRHKDGLHRAGSLPGCQLLRCIRFNRIGCIVISTPFSSMHALSDDFHPHIRRRKISQRITQALLS